MELTMIKQTANIYEDILGAIFLASNQQVSQRNKTYRHKTTFFERTSCKETIRK
jgi:hypothetical protein